MRQEPLNVLAFAVPGDEANDREGMAEVMQSRLESGALRARDSGLLSQALEDELRCLTQDGATLVVAEQWSWICAWSPRPLPVDVAAEEAFEIGTDRYEATLEELGLTDGQDACFGVEILQLEMSASPIRRPVP